MQNQRLEWLKPKMDDLFQKKELYESKGKDFTTLIQSGREYRNPRICEKLIETYDIRQYGTNLPRDQFDPDGWKKRPESYYGSSMYSKLVQRRERERTPEKQTHGDNRHHSHPHYHHHHHHHSHHHNQDPGHSGTSSTTATLKRPR